MSEAPTTIFALSSGAGPTGVAVIRVSGPDTRFVLETIVGRVPPARRASLLPIRDPRTGETIDRGLVLFFEGGRSFTGEDMAEFHVHGGRAVVAAVLKLLGSLGARPAEAGAFTRRAFENGRLDLTAIEGLADLVAAETEQQRRQALRMAEGALGARAEDWRARLVAARAAIEADLDFSDEDDVPGSVADGAADEIRHLIADMRSALRDADRGERVRDGFHVAIMGPPNAGKSSLLNALAGREAAIVTDIPGTTRDVVEVHLDLAGAAVILADTAGLREPADPVEAEGIRRARARGAAADLVLWLDEEGRGPPDGDLGATVAIRTKADDGPAARGREGFPAAISVRTGVGIEDLVAAIAARAGDVLAGDPAIVTRARQRLLIEEALADLEDASRAGLPELRAEGLRKASDRIGRLTGRIDVEEVLGAIFAAFCIGK